MAAHPFIELDDYRPIIGDEAVDRIHAKAEKLRGRRVCHMNSTYYAGGVVEILRSMTMLMNKLGIPTEWRMLRGTQEFFEVTREMHDAVQSGSMELTTDKKEAYERLFEENAIRNQLDHDFVYMHDHHTMGMIAHYDRSGPWIWRCHLDYSEAQQDVVKYLAQFADLYDASVFILEKYMQDAFAGPQVAIMPAIDPLKPNNQRISEDAVMARLKKYNIPTDRPIVTQISRFDRWKDPHGVVDAFELAAKEVDATLVLLGNIPADDPDDNPLITSLLARRSDRIKVVTVTDYPLVGALQQFSTVVLQKSLREGFGLTVSEALWKGTPVIGGNAGGIPAQIDHGVNGYLVNSVDEAAGYIVEMVSNPQQAKEMGEQGIEKVRGNFLITRLLEDHFDLLTGLDAM
ncbi:MAG: glycosyltransferase [Chloroflexota bacterium]